MVRLLLYCCTPLQHTATSGLHYWVGDDDYKHKAENGISRPHGRRYHHVHEMPDALPPHKLQWNFLHTFNDLPLLHLVGYAFWQHCPRQKA